MAFDLALLEHTAVVVVDTLRRGVDADWSVKAGTLEWDVDYTIGHMAGGMAKHTVYLATRSPRFIAVSTGGWSGATRTERIEAITDVARGVLEVARAAPPGPIAYHVTGMQTAESYVVMDCVELLVHTYDVCEGLGMPFEPPDSLCQPVLASRYPAHAGEPEPWPTLLWVNGRPHPATLGRAAAPTLEPERPPLEFAEDPGTGEWRPIRWLEPNDD